MPADRRSRDEACGAWWWRGLSAITGRRGTAPRCTSLHDYAIEGIIMQRSGARPSRRRVLLPEHARDVAAAGEPDLPPVERVLDEVLQRRRAAGLAGPARVQADREHARALGPLLPQVVQPAPADVQEVGRRGTGGAVAL